MSNHLNAKEREKANERERNLEIQKMRDSLKQTASYYLKGIDKFIEELSDEEIIAFDEYLHHFTKRYHSEKKRDVNMEKVRAFVLLFCERSDTYEVGRILSYLESAEYGWHDDNYNLNNDCLRYLLYDPKGCCKRAPNISDVDTAADILGAIGKLFFNKEYGIYTLYIFCYCLAAVFSSKLNQDRFYIPFFLQIACDRNSVLYRLIQEIVAICDVNTGILNECNDLNHSYGHCGYTIHKTHYPTQFTAKDIDDLVCNKDIPIVIDGQENERHYRALLREVANIPSKRSSLDMRDRFNILPVFVCPAIKSSFNNIFNMDLTDLEVSSEYLDLLQDNKQVLSSLVLSLVMNYSDYLFPHMSGKDRKKHPFSRDIGNHINYIRSSHPDIMLENAKNIGFLHFFFKGFLLAVRKSFTFNFEEEFSFIDFKGEPLRQNTEKNIEILTNFSEGTLVGLHKRFLPAPSSMGINDKEAVKLAKQIEKHYLNLKVFIRVTPTVVKEDRYIFSVDTLQETKDADVSGRNAETVQRRLQKYEYFRVDLSDRTTIKLIVAEKPLQDNSLSEILKHTDFADSKRIIPYAVGFDEMGEMCIADIVECPHLLLGGTTRSGKSTAIMSLLMSIAYKHRAGNVNVMILDLLGKAESDFEVFDNQPFMSSPVIKTPKAGLAAILRLDAEMRNRIKNVNLSKMPYIVCVIDEFPRLFSDIGKEDIDRLKVAMTRLLSGGRHSRIHMVLAAQDPKKENMVCGIANLPVKMAFKCDHFQRSVVILGRGGAHKLLGKGQMIFDYYDDQDKRLQGSYIKKEDIKKLLSEIKETYRLENKYPFAVDVSESGRISEEYDGESSAVLTVPPMNTTFDDKLADIIMQLLVHGEISNKAVKERAGVAYDKANFYLRKMEEYNLIPPLEDKRNARKINPIEKINVTKVSELLAKARDYLIEKDYSEEDIKNAFSQRPCSVAGQADSCGDSENDKST